MRNFGHKLKASQQAGTLKSAAAGRAHPEHPHKLNSILNLQRTIGNRAVRRLVAELLPAVPQETSPLTVQRQPARGGGAAPSISHPAIDEANKQLEILREGILPLDLYRDPKVRALSFDERVAMAFQRKLKAIFALGDLKDQRAVPTLVAVLEDTLWGTPKRGFSLTQKQMLQDAAAQSLGLIGGAVAAAKLNDLLTSKDSTSRSMAARALAGATGSQAVADLLAALKKEKDGAIKLQIIIALGRVGRAASNQEKGQIVNELIPELEKNSPDLIIAAVNALGAIGHTDATEPLLKLARAHLGIANLVSEIARALGEIGDPRAVDLLVILLKDHGSASVRREVAAALGRIRGSKAMTALKNSRAKEKDATVKAAISMAIHGKPAVLQWTFN